MSMLVESERFRHVQKPRSDRDDQGSEPFPLAEMVSITSHQPGPRPASAPRIQVVHFEQAINLAEQQTHASLAAGKLSSLDAFAKGFRGIAGHF